MTTLDIHALKINELRAAWEDGSLATAGYTEAQYQDAIENIRDRRRTDPDQYFDD